MTTSAESVEPYDKVLVLDKGYVRVVDQMGTDLNVVNAARVSFARESQTFGENDAKLVNFLWKNNHTSPFRHATLSFEIHAPLMVARQWWKYVVGSDHTMDAWNESSRRYVTEQPEFYLPHSWRAAPENKKQGSGESLGQSLNADLTSALLRIQEDSLGAYEAALADGVCVEQARLFLPAYGLYVRWRWTASLQAVGWFLSQRLADDAQREIQEYAQAVSALTSIRFPESMKAILSST